MTLPASSRRDLVKKLILAELLARPGEGPLSLRTRVRAVLEPEPRQPQDAPREQP